MVVSFGRVLKQRKCGKYSLELFGYEGDVSIGIPDLVTFIEDCIAPLDINQQVLLDAHLLIGRHQDPCRVPGNLSHKLPARLKHIVST